jgi:2-oxoglutarate ferredoxin oxidoreductase subunit beta
VKPLVHQYLRLDERFPHILCPGCGIGIVIGALIRAVAKLGIEPDRLCVVSGIGCSSRTPGYLDCETFHTLHGRAIPSATGVKLARPELTVVVIAGDGDALAIGGNHFIHAARRNLDLTLIIVNNFNYGMTGGQYSPTTPLGKFATTAPYGCVERDFDICELARASGAVFVARSTVYHAAQLEHYIREGIKHPGFSVVEVISNCHTLFGRFNRMGNAVEMLEWMRNNTISSAAARGRKREELKGKIVTGVLWEAKAPDYAQVYSEVVRRAKEVGGED